jgi:hypothetical protein
LLLKNIKDQGKEAGLKTKEVLSPLRYLLTGSFSGMGIHDLLDMLEDEQIKDRLSI